MTKKQWRLAIGAAVVAVVAIAAGLTLALTGGGSKKLSHADFERIWAETRLGDPKTTTLARWPKVPYQHYSDNLKDDCYEFADVPDPTHANMPLNIYNLCFKDGVLRTKDIL